MSGKYDDIIDLPHPEPQTHPRMPHARPRGAVRALCGAHRSPRRPCGDGAPRRRRGGAGERAVLGAVACGAELVFRDGVCLGGAVAIQAPSRPDKTSGDEAAIRPPRLFFCTKPRSSEQPHRQTADAAIRQAKRRKSSVSGMGRGALKILL